MKKFYLVSLMVCVIFVMFTTNGYSSKVYYDGRSLIPIKSLNDVQILTLTVWGEARGEDEKGKIAVISVIIQRALESRDSSFNNYSKIVLKPWQFSCFLVGDPNLPKIKRIARNWDYYYEKYSCLRECYRVTTSVLNGEIKTNRYVSEYSIKNYKTKKVNPSWSLKMVKIFEHGNHEFLAKKNIVENIKISKGKQKTHICYVLDKYTRKENDPTQIKVV